MTLLQRGKNGSSGDPRATPLREWVDQSLGNSSDAPDASITPGADLSFLSGRRPGTADGGVWNNDYREGWMGHALARVASCVMAPPTQFGRKDGLIWKELHSLAWMEHNEDLVATDYRVGVPLTYGTERFQTKLAFYHLSSHLGDEYMVRHHTLRINYSRNALVWGNSLFVTPSPACTARQPGPSISTAR